MLGNVFNFHDFHFQHIDTKVWETRIGALDERLGSFTATVTDETRRWTEQSEAFVGRSGGWWSVAVRQCEAQFVLHPSHQPVGGLV